MDYVENVIETYLNLVLKARKIIVVEKIVEIINLKQYQYHKYYLILLIIHKKRFRNVLIYPNRVNNRYSMIIRIYSINN